MDDGNFKYIISGSFLGVELNALRSAPVGYLEKVTMFPLDFEKFLWASLIAETVIDELRACFNMRKPVSDYMHRKMMELYRRYLVAGGMPSSVQEYVETDDMNAVNVALPILNPIIEL